MITRNEKTGHIVNSGDIITSFRGEKFVFVGASRVRVPGKSGKVLVRWLEAKGPGCAEYYDGVFDLIVSEE